MVQKKIDEITRKIEDFTIKNKSIDEAKTRDWLVKPFFEALGWDCSSEDFSPEDANIHGQRPDYKCNYNGEAKFLLEIKHLGHRLDEKTIRGKVNDYIGDSKIPILIITDGKRYQMYYSKLEGSAESRLFKEIVLSVELNINDLNILKYQNFKNDNPLLDLAQSVYNNQLIEDALRSLCSKPTKPFINCLNQKITLEIGHNFPEDQMQEILQNVKISVGATQENVVETPRKNATPHPHHAYNSQDKLPPFTFSELGIAVGSQLTFKNDRNITAEVLTDRNQILFEGKQLSVSSATNVVMARMGHKGGKAGTHYWEYEGETLTDRRSRMIGERKGADV